MPDSLPTPAFFRIAVKLHDRAAATEWRRVWDETQTPETLSHVGVHGDEDGLLVFVCYTVTSFTAVSRLLIRLHP